jgi:hypothetical protein
MSDSLNRYIVTREPGRRGSHRFHRLRRSGKLRNEPIHVFVTFVSSWFIDITWRESPVLRGNDQGLVELVPPTFTKRTHALGAPLR